MMWENSISARVGAIWTCFGVGTFSTWLFAGVNLVTGRALLPERVVTGGGDRECLAGAGTGASPADCSRPSLQLFRQARSSSLQCQIYSNCSRSSLQLPGNAKSPCEPHPLWTAHRFHHFALQSEPTTASQFLQLASNSNTMHNLWHP